MWSEFIAIIKEAYTGNYYLILFAISLIAIVLIKKQGAKVMLATIIISIVLFVTPVFYTYVWKRFVDTYEHTVYWRVFWLIPIIIVIAWCAASLIEKKSSTAYRTVIAAIVLLLLGFGGHYIYQDYGDNTNFKTADNHFKIPQDAILLSDALLELDEEPYAVIPMHLVSYVRQYSVDIRMAFGRNALGYGHVEDDISSLFWHLLSENPDVSAISALMRDNQIEYLVSENDHVPQEDLINAGFAFIESVQGTQAYYKIYQLT